MRLTQKLYQSSHKFFIIIIITNTYIQKIESYINIEHNDYEKLDLNQTNKYKGSMPISL